MNFDKTVLQVIPALDAGGAERTTVEIAQAIVSSGGRAIVATGGGRLTGEIEAAGGQIVILPVGSKNPFVVRGNAGRLARLIRDENADIVHVRSRAPAWSALWAARKTQTPLVATYHGAYKAAGPVKRFYNSAMVRADLVIANSDFTANAIRKTYSLKGDLITIPRGADLVRFDRENVTPAQISTLQEAWGKLGVPCGRTGFRLLLPGRLTDWKGHRTAIEAVARLKPNSQQHAGNMGDLALVFCGDSQGRGGYERTLRELIDQRGMGRVISIVGHCADMPAAYAWADAVLSPSTRPEAFGRVAVEAGAMGVPVIASDHGGARETIIDDETGILTAPGDVAALSEAISAIGAMNASDRAAMGAKAKARVREKYSRRAMCDATLGAYRQLFDGEIAGRM